MKKKLAIITSHPIQYNAPLFALLNKRNNIQVKVFYTWGKKALDKKYDPGFKKNIEWDIPLLEGYDYEFPENNAADPGSHHFNGIHNPELVQTLRQWQPAAIFVFGWSFKSHFKVLRYFKRKASILFRGDSTLLDEPEHFSIKKVLRRILLKWVYSYVDKALYTGTANKSYFLQHGMNENQLIFAPHAIENDRFLPGDEVLKKAAEWRRQKSITEANIVFLFAGKLEAKKDPALLINAFKRLDQSSAHLIMAGSGELKDALLQLGKGHSNIHFIDFQNQSQMPLLYAIADVFILPSRGPGETWGLAVNEAMASGKAVIVSDRCGCAADLVEDGVNGYVFKSRDEFKLYEKMQLLLDKKVSMQMGERSLQKIQQWNYQSVCEAIENSIN